MAQLVIGDLDDEVVEKLKRKAVERNQTLDDTIREILAEAVRPNRSEVLMELRRIRAMTPRDVAGKRFPPAEDMIRQDRDSR